MTRADALHPLADTLAHRDVLTMEVAFARLLELADERGEPLGEVSRGVVVEDAHGRR